MPAVLTAPPPAAPPAGRPTPWRWSRADYYRLGECGFLRDVRTELVRGEIIHLSPPNWPHSSAVALVTAALQAAFPAGAWVNVQSPLSVPGGEPQPDAAVIPGALRDYADHPTTALLVVEVSDSTLDYDLTAKSELYAEAGIADYWVVDLNSRTVRVRRDPRPLPPGGHAYQSEAVLGPADAVAPLAAPGVTVRVADLLP